MNEQIPVNPNERTPGAQTSAVTRDAARLRSVMNDVRRDNAPASSAEQRPEELMPIPAYLETVMPAPRQQATELRCPAPRPRTAASAESSSLDEKSRATRLRSVASLVATRQQSERTGVKSESIPEPSAMPRVEPRAAREGNVRHLEIPIYEPEHDGPTYSEGSGGSRLGVLMVLAGTIFAGLVIGIGLYAGGADMLSGLFADNSVEPIEPNPAAITERPVSEIASPGAFDSLAPTEAGMIGSEILAPGTTENSVTPAAPVSVKEVAAIESTATEPRAEQPRVAPPAADVVTGSPAARTRAESTPRSEPVKERRSTTKPEEKAPAAIAAKPAPAASSKRYTVQVRATPDEAEAKRIAKRLRGKGAKDVEVVRSEKNGSPLYRVRFKSYGTADEAQAAAGRAGFNDAWILRD